MSYYTYAHIRNDTNKIFYIGKGKLSRLHDTHNRNQHWKNIVNKHGFTAIKLAEWQLEKDAFEHECFLISCFKDMGNSLANITNGGEGSSAPKTEETKRKISLSKSGVKNTKILGDANPAKTPQSRARRSLSLKKFYQGGGKNAMQGKKRQDLAEKNRLNPRFGSKNHKNVSIKVNGVIFESIAVAAKYLNIPATKLRYWALKDPNVYKTEIDKVVVL
jgi:hypothetical protein